MMKAFKEFNEQTRLIKELARKRAPEYFGSNLEMLPINDLMKLPEATIVTLVGTYCQLRYDKKIHEDKIFEIIQAKRSRFDDTDNLVSSESYLAAMEEFSSFFNNSNAPPNLKDFIKYRLDIEYPFTILPDDELIDEAIEKAIIIFRGKEIVCVKCNSNIFQKSDSLLRSLLVGSVGGKAFPQYYCPNCGKIKYKDLPIELRKRAFRSRIVYLVFVVIFIVLLILYK